MFCTEWLLACNSHIVYERLPDNPVFYVLPVELILGKLAVVPVGKIGTIPYCMRTLSALHSRQERGQVKEAGGGISTRGP